ncbi:MAG TPA: hypothetical protein VNL70_03960 [Tepidisphaeraceae bacterium]|nr:hypothetical protein [Tepidisphaeraceae bacterium]
MKERMLTMFALAVGPWLCASPALADIVFSDNFETVPDPSPHTWAAQEADPGLRTQSDPVNTVYASFSAQPGQWFQYDASNVPPHSIQVTNVSPPGAANGNNYLRIHRGVGQNSAAIAAVIAPWDAPFTTGIVTASFRAYFPSSNTTGFHGGIYGVSFLDNDHSIGTTGSKATLFVRHDPPGVIRASFNLFNNNPNLSSPVASEDQWQLWTITSNLDTQTYTVDVAGVSSGPHAFNFPGPAMNGIAFSAIEGAEFYIDDVVIDYVIPEPGSLGLAVATCAVALRRRRRD